MAVAALDELLGLTRRVRIEASPLIEISHGGSRSGDFEWVSLVNHSGLLDNVLHGPLPIRNVEIRVLTEGATSLVNGP